jgi:hypothetical protein
LVFEPSVIQGRHIAVADLEQVRQLLAEHPDWSRRRLSQHLATLWNWRNPMGQLKDMAARTLLLKLERRGWIVLPPRRQVPSNRMRPKPMPTPQELVGESPLLANLGTLLPLEISEVSPAAGTHQRALFENLLRRHHYLSYRSSVGENLQYLVSDRQGRPLACVLFGAAAWQCADRDAYIGWDAATRSQGLHLIANNSRFLIAPWVGVPSLASHLLSRIARRLSRDWQRKYGHPIYLLETFVQRNRLRAVATGRPTGGALAKPRAAAARTARMVAPTDGPSKTFIFISCTRALRKGCKATALNPNPLTHTSPSNIKP